jgi:hypothetical protein
MKRPASGTASARVRALVGALALVLTVPSSASQSTSQAPRIVRVFEDGRFIQVLYGDPDREGGHYVIRIGNDDGQIVFPHRHPEDEHIVVIQGTWFLGHGEAFNRAALEEMPVGTYGVVPKTMAHFAWSRGETIIQVHGIGPFKQVFVDQITRITQTGAERYFKYKVGDRVGSPKGPGVVANGYRTAKLVQYQLKRDDAGLYWALEEDLRPLPHAR